MLVTKVSVNKCGVVLLIRRELQNVKKSKDALIIKAIQFAALHAV